jgi:osmoprotectant transport system substrate-binding protein
VTLKRRRLSVAFVAALLAVMVVLFAAACGGDDDSGSSSTPKPGDGVSVTIADKGFSESFIVAQAYAQALKAQGFDTSVTSLGSTEIADKAIRNGEIDVYPEYVGTSYQSVLKLNAADAPASKEAQFEQVKTEYAKRGLTALTPAPFNNGNAVACTQEAVDKYHIENLTDLGKASANITYSANPEHLTRPDGLPLLKKEYGFNPKAIKTVDISLRYKPIEDGQANCVYAFGTDPALGKDKLVLIPDDKGTYSAGLSYQTFPVVSTKFFDSMTPDQQKAFTDTLDKVNAAFTQDAIIPLISRVEFDKEDPEDVAKEFLSNAGIAN